MRDLSERQSQLFFFVATLLAQYEAPEFQPLVDEDAAEAASSLAATFETSVKGVIYEHRPASLPAQRLQATLKTAMAEASAQGGTAFDRDAATVLRRTADAARGGRTIDPGDPRAFLALLRRVIARRPETAATPAAEPSKLIVP